MPKAYWVATYRSIKNPDALAAYAKIAAPAIQSSGGRFLVRGNPIKTYEAGMNQRVVVIEFDSVAQAVAAHDSSAYQAALKALKALELQEHAGDRARRREHRVRRRIENLRPQHLADSQGAVHRSERADRVVRVQLALRSTRATTGQTGESCSPKPASASRGSTTPATPQRPCCWSKASTSASCSRSSAAIVEGRMRLSAKARSSGTLGFR